ncbi:nuclear transport factor 2 family protein [Sphingomonas montanisoli]|uniref:Nuclear transport factor 2 family protein n=1 Tax=Sphingomonas montanisoli TaxID=2606412 RepID=A0A5D9C8C6_9SPHN|nr:nuclear transport factor 2 family protein [Sphingomonas montanisoli]TZG27979.1 nuclear transport factor 2 family protein [Sphingomonas montanisoli]
MEEISRRHVVALGGAVVVAAALPATVLAAPKKPLTITERLDRVESRTEISELRSRYARFAVNGDYRGVAGLFTEDCVFDGPAGPGKRAVVKGRDNLAAFLAPSIGKRGAVYPLIHNEIIEVDGERATGWCMMESPTAPGFGHIVCEYHDKFARIDGRWYFTSRTMYLFLPTYEERPASA